MPLTQLARCLREPRRTDEPAASRAELERRVELLRRAAFEELPEPLPCTATSLGRLDDADALAGEHFDILRAKLEAAYEQGARLLGVVSTTAGEGRTTIALGLALALARLPGRRVLLLEADLRRPSLERALGLRRRVGLNDWLGGLPGPLRLRRVEPGGLCLITAGTPAAGSPAAALESDRIGTLFAVLPHLFDWVIVDCPPAAHFADDLILQHLMDGLLLVVRSRVAERSRLRAFVRDFRADAVLGVVYNDHRDRLRRSPAADRRYRRDRS